MRTLTGAILLLTAELAFAHAHMIGFPHAAFAHEFLLPTSLVFALLGLGFLIWGILTERSGKGGRE